MPVDQKRVAVRDRDGWTLVVNAWIETQPR